MQSGAGLAFSLPCLFCWQPGKWPDQGPGVQCHSQHAPPSMSGPVSCLRPAQTQSALQGSGIPVPTHIKVNRDGLQPDQDPPGFVETEDYVELNGTHDAGLHQGCASCPHSQAQPIAACSSTCAPKRPLMSLLLLLRAADPAPCCSRRPAATADDHRAVSQWGWVQAAASPSPLWRSLPMGTTTTSTSTTPTPWAGGSSACTASRSPSRATTTLPILALSGQALPAGALHSARPVLLWWASDLQEVCRQLRLPAQTWSMRNLLGGPCTMLPDAALCMLQSCHYKARCLMLTLIHCHQCSLLRSAAGCGPAACLSPASKPSCLGGSVDLRMVQAGRLLHHRGVPDHGGHGRQGVHCGAQIRPCRGSQVPCGGRQGHPLG